MRTNARKLVTVPLMAGLTLMATVTASGGEYCKWTDESGVVHFAEKCPDNVTSTIVTTEGKRTESQKRAAEEYSKSLLSKPTRVIDSTVNPWVQNQLLIRKPPLRMLRTQQPGRITCCRCC